MILELLRLKLTIEFAHLYCLKLRPDLEEEKNPAPSFLGSGLQPPPGKTGEDEVKEKARDDDKDATPELRVQSHHQAGIGVNVDTGHQDVEHEQLQSGSHNIRQVFINP